MMLILNPSFDEADHIYTDADGKPVRSVTQIMEDAGLSNEWAKDEYAGNWGTIAHKNTELLINGDPGTLDPSFGPWKEGILQFIAHKVPRLRPERKCETRFILKEPGAVYAGTIDFEGLIWHNSCSKEWLLDWKFWSGKSKQSVALAGIQTAAYEYATRGKERKRRRGVVWFKPNGYELIELNNSLDYVVWRSALNCSMWKEANT